MLSSLPGTAATSIKIAGVQHEFSTIPGVKEDVTEIVLNVKDLLVKLHAEGTKTVYIEAVGPCEVTAADIKADGEVEVLNPGAAHRHAGQRRHAEYGDHALPRPRLCVRGAQQARADHHRRDPVDSIYTPVTR
jgi:DNA-directed RNA polymerase subunit alpha